MTDPSTDEAVDDERRGPLPSAPDALADASVRRALRPLTPVRHDDPPAPRDPAALLAESRAPLLERMRAEIEREGRITFARFMDVALYDPEDGYYTRSADRPTRSGDFLTAPETHPLFAATIARQLEESWERLGRPGTFVLREYGAGRGTLGLGVARALRARAAPLLEALRYQPVERAPAPRERIHARFEAHGLAAIVEDAHGAYEGCGLGNEVLDALPVHRLAVIDGSVRELYVVWRDGWLAEEPGDLSDPSLVLPLRVEGIDLQEGQRLEVRPSADAWVADAASALERGWLILVDYGFPAPELYGPTRSGGTLRTFRAHRAGAEPFRAVGEQDLTAHVDLSAVERAARAAGLDLLGRTTQAEFLVGAGLETELRSVQERATTAAEVLAARAAVLRFLDPAATGRFAVLVFGRGVPAEPPLAGLAFRMPSR